MHIKNFKKWGEEKERLNISEITSDITKFSPRIREVVYAKFGINIGFEADGKKNFMRPVLILAKIGSMYWVAPLTSKLKENYFHHELLSVKFPTIKHSLVMLYQARIIDEKRCFHKIGEVQKIEFQEIQKKMKSMYFPS